MDLRSFINRKFIVGGIAGGVITFAFVYVFSEILPASYKVGFFSTTPRTDDLFSFVAVASLAWGFLFAFLINLRGREGFVDAAKLGVIIGALFSLGMGFLVYAQTHTFIQSVSGVLIFAAVSTLWIAISFGLIATVMSKL